MKRSYLGIGVVFALTANYASGSDLDLTAAVQSGTINGAIFKRVTPTTAAGTGVFKSFLRIQNEGQESGYNTNGTLEFDSKEGKWTHALQLSKVPTVTVDGISYREFCLDINQPAGKSLLSLDELKIHLGSTGSLTGYSKNFSSPIYDLDQSGDNWVKLDYALNPGSGRYDMVMYIPSSLFVSGNGEYVYLYSKFGVNCKSGDGFEEWGVGEFNGTPTPIIPVPEPVTILLLSGGALAFIRRR